MSQQLNFAQIKQDITIIQGAKYLGLTLKEDGNSLRTSCPVCEGDERSLSILEESNSFKCFKSGEYGSILDMVCHVRDVGLRDAGKWLLEQAEKPEKAHQTGEGLKELTYLNHSHEMVTAMGFKPEDAELFGIGFANKGMMKGHVAVPIRLADSTLVGYIGIKEAKLPKRWSW